jgi:hypothetical protein
MKNRPRLEGKGGVSEASEVGHACKIFIKNHFLSD